MESLRAYIDGHVGSLVELTVAFLKARPARAGLVFFASQAAFWTSPFASIYAATKSFTFQFADSISAECPSVDVLCVSPGAVNGTSFFELFPDFWFFWLVRKIGQTPGSVASLVFRAIGRVRLVDTGVFTSITRIATSFIYANLVNMAGQIAARSLPL
jgi:short-subunit dehydrogenase